MKGSQTDLGVNGPTSHGLQGLEQLTDADEGALSPALQHALLDAGVERGEARQPRVAQSARVHSPYHAQHERPPPCAQ